MTDCGAGSCHDALSWRAPVGDEGRIERLMTVANVRPGAGGAEVMFLESARIYRLLQGNLAYDDAMRRLAAAARSGRLVRVRFSEPDGEIIVAVAEGTRN